MSRHVVFDEGIFPHSSISSTLHHSSSSHDVSVVTPVVLPLPFIELLPSLTLVSFSSLPASVSSVFANQPSPTTDLAVPTPTITNCHPMVIHSKARIYNSKVLIATDYSISVEPTTHKEALKDLNFFFFLIGKGRLN